MATEADIRRAALALPEAIEVQDRHGLWFNIGRKSFITYWANKDRWIFKLAKPHQELLFEVRPEVFEPYRAGAMLWSYVDIAALSRAEAKDLVTEAWTMVAPKRVSKAFLDKK